MYTRLGHYPGDIYVGEMGYLIRKYEMVEVDTSSEVLLSPSGCCEWMIELVYQYTGCRCM